MTRLQRPLLLLFFFFSWLAADAAYLSGDQIRLAAQRFASDKIGLTVDELTVQFTLYDEQNIVMRAFDIPGGGFVLLSGLDAAYPLLAYSMEGSFTGEMSPAMNEWLSMYREQILLIRQMELEGKASTHPEWIRVLSGYLNSGSSETVPVGPLLTCNWNQGKYYNDFCPDDPDGPGGKVYAGCVATAMGMAMHHFKYPSQGTGSHSYQSYNYGYLSANFGATSYNWYAMDNSCDNHYNDDVAKLLFHCGVGVEMNYSTTGSGAYMWMARNTLVNYFGYSSSTTLTSKNSYTDAGWKTMIKQQLDDSKPIIYAGYPQGGGSGHAFVLDGYQGDDHFHFNWGWSAAFNGYYYLSSLSPGNSNFSGNQQAIINLYPGSNYPVQCAGNTVLTSETGMIFDGSGTSDYSNDVDCTWKISPGNVEKIIITIDRISIADIADSLIIYNGGSTADSIVMALNTDSLPSAFYVFADEVLVRFKTNSSGTADGFILSYQAVLQDYCKGTTLLTNNSGNLSDGSGGDSYRNGSLCKWLLEPQNGEPVQLTFTSMDLNQGDFVRIYDNGTQPGTVLGQFYSNQLPPPVVAMSGKMLIIFFTDQQHIGSGWEATWISGPGVGFGEHPVPTFNIYPNPAGNSAVVDLNNANGTEKLQLFDVMGRLLPLDYHYIGESTIYLPLENLANGMYWLRVYSNQGTRTRKLEIIR